jgi:hypothetical protein
MPYSELLFELTCKYARLGVRARFERAVAAAAEAAAEARTCAPGSFAHIAALLWCAEYSIAQAQFSGDHLPSEVHDGVLCKTAARIAIEDVLFREADAAITEALPLLLARFEAKTLLPGDVPAFEADFDERVICRVESIDRSRLGPRQGERCGCRPPAAAC